MDKNRKNEYNRELYNKMTPEQKQLKRERDRRYYLRNKEKCVQQATDIRHKTLEECRSHLGGKCAWCGSTEDLQFDHIDPAQKLGNICKFYRKAKREKLWEEVNKCQLLCKVCHHKRSNAQRHAAHKAWLMIPFEERMRLEQEELDNL